MSNTKNFRVLIADDHPVFRGALVDILHNVAPEATLYEAADYKSAMASCQQHRDLDLILMDLYMPDMHGLTGLMAMRDAQPATPLVIVSASDDLTTISQISTSGAAGYIMKSEPREDMINAIKRVLAGDLYFPSMDSLNNQGGQCGLPPMTGVSAEDEELQKARDAIASLTPQQRVVLDLIGQGMANKMIAYELHISESTVKAHVSATLKKLNVYSRTQLALLVSKL